MFTQAMFVPLGVFFLSGAAIPRLNMKVRQYTHTHTHTHTHSFSNFEKSMKNSPLYFQGALLSSFIPSALILWMIVGGELYGEQDNALPLPTSQCPGMLHNNGTSSTTVFPQIADNNSESARYSTKRFVESTSFH